MLSSSILFCRQRLFSSVAVTNKASTTVITAAAACSSLSSISSSSWFSSYAQQQSPDDEKDQQEFVSVLKLNMLQDNPGAVKKRRRIGRGIGSSKGKTSGRGHKGQKARSGGSIPLFFEGGQTRFFKLLPKRGFTNKRHKADMVSLNVGTIQDYIDMGRFPTIPEGNNEIPVWTMKDLLDAGMFTASSVKHGIKLLGQGKEKLRTPFRLEISRASESAIAAIESIGGEVTTVHYNNLALRALLKPHKFGVQEQASPTKQATQTTNKKAVRQKPKFARPPPKWQPYYTNWENRGYLSVQAQMRKLLFERPELEEKFAKTLDIEIDDAEKKE